MYISIGVDCGTSEFLKKYNLRHVSLPFDWCVTYKGVSDIIKNDFISFIPIDNKINDYGCSFVHNNFPKDNDKIKRRIDRFRNILETYTETITFIRKGHACHNHIEYDIKNDIIDCEELDNILKIKYPRLSYKIIVVLICNKCFNENETFISNSNIEIHNISMSKVDDTKFQNILLNNINI